MHTLIVTYRPDDYPQWLPWKAFIQEFDMIGKPGELDGGGKPKTRAGFAPRASLSKPENRCDETTGRNLRRGFNFQVKFNGSGHVIISRFRIHAQRQVEKSTAT
jgi:hypothetical protein